MSGIIIALLLTLGISSNTIIFSLVNALLLRPLPVERPRELVQLMHLGGIVYPEFQPEFCGLMREHPPDAFSDVACEGELDLAFSEGGNVERVHVNFVSPNYFRVLGVQTLYGQLPVASDEAALSYAFWQRWFGSDVNVLGRKVLLEGHPFNVVGVLPRGFNGIQADSGPDVRITQSGEEALSLGLERGALPWVFGRLRAGATLAQATAEAQVVLKAADLEMQSRRPPFEADDKLRAVSIAKGVSLLRERFSNALILLMAGIMLLLLIVCANVGGLMLARAAARSRETAVQIAVGATRERLLRQVAAECGVFVLIGGTLGTALAYMAMPWVIRAMPPLRNRAAVSLPLELDVSPDVRVALFTIGLCALAAFLFALAPAAASAGVDVNETLKAALSSPRTTRLTGTLVAAQVALCTVLLCGAGLLVRTLHQLRSLDAGFEAQHVVTFSLEPRMAGYTREQGRLLEERLLEQVRSLPGVLSDSYAARGLMRGTGVKTTLMPTGVKSGTGDTLNTSMNWVTPDYFDTMGIRVLAGHGLTGHETASPPTPAVVNQALARRFFPGRDAIGEHLGGEDPAKPGFEIIGIVSDAKYRSLREEIPPTIYMAQVLDNGSNILHVRTASEPSGIINAVRGELRSLDARLPFYEVHTLQEEVDGSLWQERLVAALSSVFGFMAAALAGVGLYGMLAHAMTQRTREIGIRMALGAFPGAIAQLVTRHAIAPVIAGVAAGLILFTTASPWIANLLYGVSPRDPVSILLGVGAVAIIAAIAVAGPAWRATRVDPFQTLRQDL